MAGCVIELQNRCPDARVVYCSATGISEIGNMAYMQRLGFWGAGTPFADADRFITVWGRCDELNSIDPWVERRPASNSYVTQLKKRKRKFGCKYVPFKWYINLRRPLATSRR